MILADAQPCMMEDTRVRRTRLLTIAAAVVAALIVWFVAGSLAGVDLDVRSGDGTSHVGVVPVIIATALGGAVAWALAALLERFASRPRALWVTVMVIALVLSVAGPLSLGIGGATRGALIVMHQVVGGTLIAGMLPTIRKR